MIVNQLCTQLTGGAAIAAQRLHGALRQAGVDSRFWHSPRTKGSSTDPSVLPLHWPQPNDWWGRGRGWVSWLQRRVHWNWTRFRQLRRRPPGFEIFTPARLPVDTRYCSTTLPGDILHLHWVAKLIDIPSFFASVPADLPVVWTLHDMNPFTGGCHFSSGCRAFHAACGNCPQIAVPDDADVSRQFLTLKQNAVRNKNLHIVAPSRWLAEMAGKSAVFSSARSFHTIPYGLDLTSLSPQNSSAARRQLQIPEHAFVLGFGADSLANRRKGLAELLAALQQLHTPVPLVAVVFGGGEIPSAQLGVTVVPVGYVRGAERLAQLYSAMNLFVLPSLEDNLPQTGLEAMACGTPLVAFEAGGIPDFVLHGETGLLARTADATDLARQIQWLIDHPDALGPMGQRARRLIVDRFGSQREAASYVALYQEILAEQSQSRGTRAA